jgi:hypothetical protein
MRLPTHQTVRADFPHTALHQVLFLLSRLAALLPRLATFLALKKLLCSIPIFLFSVKSAVRQFSHMQGDRGRSALRARVCAWTSRHTRLMDFKERPKCRYPFPVPHNRPSYRHIAFFAVQIPFIQLVLPSFAWCSIVSPFSSADPRWRFARRRGNRRRPCSC